MPYWALEYRTSYPQFYIKCLEGKAEKNNNTSLLWWFRGSPFSATPLTQQRNLFSHFLNLGCSGILF